MYRRGGIWYFSINGVRCSSGTKDKQRAAAKQRQLENEAWDRRNGFHVPTWDEACLSWLTEHQHLKSYTQQKIFARWWKKHLTGKKLNAITKVVVHRTITTHRKVDVTKPCKQNSTANVYVYFVEKIIRSVSNIKPRFIHYPERKAERWLRPEEWVLLVAHMPPDLRDVSTFAVATGLRENNVLGFEWGWLHKDRAYLPSEVTKTDKPYGIPLSSASQAVIEDRRKATIRHPKYVFNNEGKIWTCVMLLRALRKAVAASGIPPMTFHTLRHTFASWIAQKGVSDAVRCRLGCWSIKGESGKYVHFDVEGLRPFSEMLVPNLSQRVPTALQVFDGKHETA